MPTFRIRRGLLAAALALAGAGALAQAPAPSVRLHGTIESADAAQLVLQERNGRRTTLAIAPDVAIREVYPVALSDVKPGSFVGIGALPQANGPQRAIAVLLFPEAMRGTGEGHRPFDFMPQSTMTNATVAEVAAVPGAHRLALRYKGGEQVIDVLPEAPVVSLRDGDRSLLVPGANVSLTAQEVGGKPTATRISAGRNGFRPPY